MSEERYPNIWQDQIDKMQSKIRSLESLVVMHQSTFRKTASQIEELVLQHSNLLELTSQLINSVKDIHVCVRERERERELKYEKAIVTKEEWINAKKEDQKNTG